MVHQRPLAGAPVSGFRFRVMLEVNNVFSQDYDVILNYPMPKRNYGLTIDMKI